MDYEEIDIFGTVSYPFLFLRRTETGQLQARAMGPGRLGLDVGAMRVIIAGGRDFNDYQKLMEFCDKILQNQDVVEIVSGTACGADRLGERYAKEKGFNIERFPADWDKFKKSAGYIRNKQMAEYADALIAFWDGKSKGTKHMIDLAKEKGLKVRVYKY